MLVLSVFPGIDMLGQGFELEGFCVVRGPDLIWGGDVRRFHPPPKKFDGVIGGPPCQEFSVARILPATGHGMMMIQEFIRVVTEASPIWFLMENVPAVPGIEVAGYTMQRIPLNARECGMRQNRLRHFQFGHREGYVISPVRDNPAEDYTRCVTASDSRSWRAMARLQGLTEDFDVPAFTISAKKRAIGNGVPIPMARVLARAIMNAQPPTGFECACSCGRTITGRKRYANAACRKRAQRKRERDRPWCNVTQLGHIAPGRSRKIGNTNEQECIRNN